MEAKDFITYKVWNRLERVQQIAELTNNFESANENKDLYPTDQFDFMKGFPMNIDVLEGKMTISDNGGYPRQVRSIHPRPRVSTSKVIKKRIGQVYAYVGDRLSADYYLRFLGEDNGVYATESQFEKYRSCAEYMFTKVLPVTAKRLAKEANERASRTLATV